MRTIERTVPTPPEGVAAAIKEAIRSARGAELPSELRDGGITGLTGRVGDRRFKVWFNRRWVSGDVDTLDLRGEVVPAGAGTTVVRARASREHTPLGGMLVFAGIAGVIALTGGGGARVMLLVALAVGAIAFLQRASGSPDDPEIVYLMSWIEDVLDGLSVPGAEEAAAAPREPRNTPS